MKTFSLFHTSFLMLAGFTLNAQEMEHPTAARYFEQLRKGIYAPIPGAISGRGDEAATLKFLIPLCGDSVPLIKAKACELIYSLAKQSADTMLRKNAAEALVSVAGNDDPETTGLVLRLISGLNKNDFSDSAKNIVRSRVTIEGLYLNGWMKIAGFLHLTDLIPAIRPYAQPGNPHVRRWAAIISLSRLGETFSLSEMMRRIKKLPVNDHLIYQVFPDVIYTRQPVAIDYMVEALYSESKDCLSADAEREISIPCGYRIMEQLAPIIEGFPFTLEDNGDLKTQSYAGALEAVRVWFRANRRYRILNDTW